MIQTTKLIVCAKREVKLVTSLGYDYLRVPERPQLLL